MPNIFTYYALLCIFFLSPASAKWNKYFAINSNNWRFTEVWRLEKNIQKVKCLALCSKTTGCETVNHKSNKNICEILKPGNWTPTADPGSESYWAVYYKGDQRVSAIDAWQTSTRSAGGNSFHSAYLAIDGNRDNSDWKYCAHTDDYSSSWAMEFEHVAEVSHIIVYFKNSELYNYRNTNLRFLISETRQDSDSNIGTDCATYFGPPESSLPPVKIFCTQPVTGKFLKIVYNMAQHLVLCEVEIYSSRI